MKNPHAFSLIELMVVIGIIVVFTALTTIYIFNFYSNSTLRFAALEIAATLSQARSLAITRQIEYGVAFDDLRSRYFVYKVIDANNAEKVIGTDHNIKEGIIIESTTFSIDNRTNVGLRAEIFNANGSAEDNGSIFLKNPKGKYNTITVINATGRVKIFNYYRSG